MKKKTICLCFLALWLQVASGSGDLGDFSEKTVTSLPELEVQKYLTQYKIVGREKDQEQCSEEVFAYRKKMEVIKQFFFLISIFINFIQVNLCQKLLFLH